jgi:PTS system mannose-specific IIB component
MAVVLTRIDQKLIHGQILSAWVPFLDIDGIVVVDEDTTQQPLVMRIMSSAVPDSIATEFLTPDQLAGRLEDEPPGGKTLVLFKDVAGAKDAIKSRPKEIYSINLGYYSHIPGVRCVKIHSFFSAVEAELEQLVWIANQGLELYAQPVPNAPKVHVNPAKLVWPGP